MAFLFPAILYYCIIRVDIAGLLFFFDVLRASIDCTVTLGIRGIILISVCDFLRARTGVPWRALSAFCNMDPVLRAIFIPRSCVFPFYFYGMLSNHLMLLDDKHW